MRIIHSADWHIGQSLRGFSREKEHANVLGQLVDIVREREADALIVAGDVYDSQHPSGESQALFYETLLRLHNARPGMAIVITAGNHDAAGRLEAPRSLLEPLGVHIVGNLRRVDGQVDAARHLIPLLAQNGEIAAHVLAVSYPTAACLPGLTRLEGEDGSPVARAVQTLYGDLYDGVRPLLAGLPLLVTGHLHVAGGLESEGAERRILVGGDHAVPPEVFPEEAVYVALGHLHKAQKVGRETIRYSGSLIPLSATEQPYRHGVTLITLAGGAPEIEHISFERPLPFLRLPSAGYIRLDEVDDRLAALGLAPDLPVDQQPFMQIRLSREGLSAGFRAEVDRIAERYAVRIVDIPIAAPEQSTAESGDAAPLVRLAECQPEELFRSAFEKLHAKAPDAAHLDIFHRMAEEA